MKKVITILALIISAGSVLAQKKTTTSATVSFDATTPKDGLPKAENKTVIGSINTKTGEVAFEAAVKNFTFTNPQMQGHFNGDNWFKSNTYPVIGFTGKIDKLNAVKFTKNGVYKVSVTGDLKIRDISKQQKIKGTITVKDGKVSVASDFIVKLADYNITGVPVDAGKVAKEPKVSVRAEF
jgi:polyisoprenoid-binding protein YceI